MSTADLSQTVPIQLVVTAKTDQANTSLTETQQLLQQIGKSGFQGIQAGLDTMLTGLVHGTESMRQLMAKSVEAMVTEFGKAQLHMETAALQSLVGISNGNEKAAQGSLIHWILAEAGITGATDAAVAHQTAAKIQGATAGNAVDSVSASKSITTHAASAAAAVYDDVSQIPVVGWLLAPPAAALAYGTVAAFAGMIPGLEVGAWEIPSTMLALLHPGESVVPANFASGLRASGILGNGAASATASAPVSVTFQVSALDAASVSAFFNTHGATLARTLASVQNRNPSLRPGY